MVNGRDDICSRWNNGVVGRDQLVVGRDHHVQLPEHFRANKKLGHITKSIIQVPLEH